MHPQQILARTILEQAEFYKWQVQGFGMLKLYLGKDARLHIWDSVLRYPDVSMIHTHSWHLKSTILGGILRNVRFIEHSNGIFYHKHRIIAGENTQVVSGIDRVQLLSMGTETYTPGKSYFQASNEIHQTIAEDGTVTLMERSLDSDGMADIYWPLGTQWGTAKPRLATYEEIKRSAEKALRILENSQPWRD